MASTANRCSLPSCRPESRDLSELGISLCTRVRHAQLRCSRCCRQVRCISSLFGVVEKTVASGFTTVRWYALCHPPMSLRLASWHLEHRRSKSCKIYSKRPTGVARWNSVLHRIQSSCLGSGVTQSIWQRREWRILDPETRRAVVAHEWGRGASRRDLRCCAEIKRWKVKARAAWTGRCGVTRGGGGGGRGGPWPPERSDALALLHRFCKDFSHIVNWR